MPTPVLSGTYAFNPSAYYIVLRALRQVQAIAQGEVPSDAEAQDAAFALNSLIKAWQGSGIHVWAEADYTLFLQPNQTSYNLGLGTTDQWTLSSQWQQLVVSQNAAAGQNVIIVNSVASIATNYFIGVQTNAGSIFWSVIDNINGFGTNSIFMNGALPSAVTGGALAFSYAQSPAYPRPLRIPAGRRYIYQGAAGGAVSGQPNEIPLIPMSRLDYAAQPNKSNTGAVTQFFYDPQYDPTGVWYCWPTPQDDMSGIKFTGQRPLQDVDVLTNLVDFPKEWINALTWNLALELGAEYDVVPERYAIIKEQAQRWYAMASSWDRETGSVLFGAANNPAYRSG